MQNAEKEQKVVGKIFLILEGMNSFSEAKKSMFLPIKDSIAEALTDVEELRKISDWAKATSNRSSTPLAWEWPRIKKGD